MDLPAVQRLSRRNASYPTLLAAIPDPPPELWVSGDARALIGAAVAIVGARHATPYALDVAARLGADLAARDIVVVSGLARGVDSAAHRGALDANGRTVAVLGSGVDVVYPREHVELAAAIARRGGAIVSELAPGEPPRKGHFPRRNRIISGLSLAVVVVEAAEKSGSLITASCALEQGREVMAVPGNVLSGRNRGSHALLRDGAKIVESADDIVEELNLPARLGAGAAARGRIADPLLAVMVPGESYDFDALAAETGIPPAKLLARLVELELAGAIARVPGGRFVRSTPAVLT